MALAIVPAAEASQGHDTVYRWSYVSYEADPGEANNILAEPWNSGSGLHLKDTGAIIRWTSLPTGVLAADCYGGGHDVWCLGQYGLDMGIHLGDRSDRFVNKSGVSATVYARDGVRDYITCGSSDYFDEVQADALDVITNPGACNIIERG
jgi:hypothetical protein